MTESYLLINATISVRTKSADTFYNMLARTHAVDPEATWRPSPARFPRRASRGDSSLHDVQGREEADRRVSGHKVQRFCS